MHTYILSQEDLLTILIYDFSINPKKTKRRKRSVWILFASFSFLSIVSYLNKDILLSGIFIVIAVLFLLFGDIYLKHIYKKAFRKAVKNDLNSMVGSPIQVTFESDHIHVDDKVGDANFQFSQILWVNEITGYFIIKLSSGQVLGIPKGEEKLKIDIENMVSSHNLPHQINLDWKW